MDTKSLRREVQRLGPVRRGRRFPAELRERLLAAVRELRADGMEFGEIGAALEISSETARRYHEQRRAPRLRRVEITPTMSEERLTLVSASGHRIEGLSVEGAATLMRLLS